MKLIPLVLLAQLAILSAHASGSSIPVERFFERPQFDGARLSPDGRMLALKVGGPNGRYRLAVLPLETMAANIVVDYYDSDVGHFGWINANRLHYDLASPPGSLSYGWPGLYAVNHDGSQRRQLVQHVGMQGSVSAGTMPANTRLVTTAGPDSDDVVVEQYFPEDANGYRAEAFRLNTVTGQETRMPAPPAPVWSWVYEKGAARLAYTSAKGTTTIHALAPGAKSWRELTSYPSFAGNQPFLPLGFGVDGKLYAATQTQEGTRALASIDLTVSPPKPTTVLAVKDFDFYGNVVESQGKVLGFTYLAESMGTHWIDPVMRSLQDEIDKLLPGTVNQVTPPKNGAQPWVLVDVSSDRQAPQLYLFNRSTKQLKKVGDTRPALRPDAMAPKGLVRYRARDGMDIPAWLTLPGGEAQKRPMVVLVHGGPWVRGSRWEWDEEAQFLASRGYVVLQPEFRGSTGFGEKHFRAGFKQWGQAMQDDLADGVRWAIEQGYAAPGRVCILGASYGGYAALMGLAKDGSLYACGASHVGVSDIHLLFKGPWYADSNVTPEFRRYGMPTMVGDPDKDAAMLKAHSPLQLATRITQPVLLAYGTLDRIVPIYHGKEFRDAVTQHNKTVEWVEYPMEGHGFYDPRNRIDYWTRVEKFLKKHIGN